MINTKLVVFETRVDMMEISHEEKFEHNRRPMWSDQSPDCDTDNPL